MNWSCKIRNQIKRLESRENLSGGYLERTGLMRLVHEANRRFCKSLEGVELAIRWLGLVEDRGEIMEETARFKRVLVGVLLKLNARFT